VLDIQACEPSFGTEVGHRSVDTTHNHYAFSSNARRRATIEAFDV